MLVLLYFTITKFSFATDLPDGREIVDQCFQETYQLWMYTLVSGIDSSGPGDHVLMRRYIFKVGLTH